MCDRNGGRLGWREQEKGNEGDLWEKEEEGGSVTASLPMDPGYGLDFLYQNAEKNVKYTLAYLLTYLISIFTVSDCPYSVKQESDDDSGK